jgi:mannitol/fructose-specific phosphotransferase system IIA component (Ntr-type)
MTISEFLNESNIRIGLDARNKREAIEEVVDLLVEEHEISMASRSSVIEAVMDREQMVSTGMEHGVAIPHGAVDSVDELVAALIVSKDGIDFKSIDGKPAHIIILLILPANKYSSSVQTMACVSRIMNSKTLRENILSADDPADIMDLIVEEEERQLLA